MMMMMMMMMMMLMLMLMMMQNKTPQNLLLGFHFGAFTRT